MARNPQTEVVMPTLLVGLEKAGLPMAQVKEAMDFIGCGRIISTNLTGGSRSERREV